MKISKLSLAVVGVLVLTNTANATLTNDKITLKGNMIVKYNKLPSSVDTISEVFTEGIVYGRLRSNMFKFDWDKDNENTKLRDHTAIGLGGSLVYKTAPMNGLSATLGVYASYNPSFMTEEEADVGFIKAGKDTFSRRAVATDGDFGMTTIGQAYLQYDVSKTSFVLGRQLFETVFTKSNDTKMIPNSFDGVSATIKEFPKTTIQLAYFAKQKLRDHTNAHDVIAYKNTEDNWSENDDSSVNKNLTVDRIGDNNSLLIATITNKSIKNLKLNASYALVPDVLSNFVLEGYYKIPLTNGWSVTPGIRFMNQFDHLNANYDVANLGGKHDGYNDKNSLDSYLIATRLDIKNKAFLARLGFSQIADKADIVAPWRGFPTGGFTRAMGQYNWKANTKTYMLRLGYDFGKAGILDGFSVMGRYAIQDFDDKKVGTPADSHVIHLDFRQNIGKNLEAKFRLGFVDVDDNIKDMNGNLKSDTSYNEYRFELNYFF